VPRMSIWIMHSELDGCGSTSLTLLVLGTICLCSMKWLSTCSVLRYCVDLAPNKGSLLSKILFVTARTIQKDAEEKKVSFNPRPYFRLFINLLSELSTADLHDAATFQVLTAFANAFHVLQPLRVPAWRFAISFESSCNL
jgi:hypothetical protein